MFDLVIVHEFGPYRIGQRISAPDEVEAILGGSNASKTVKVPPDTRSAEPVEADGPAVDPDPQSSGSIVARLKDAVGLTG